MESNFLKVKNYLLELEYHIMHDDPTDEVMVVEKVEDGITNLAVGVAEPLLILEQVLFEVKRYDAEFYKQLLIKNREIVHGAFALSEEGTHLLFRDTLQLENLDLNELEAALNSLSLLLSEYSDQLIEFSQAPA